MIIQCFTYTHICVYKGVGRAPRREGADHQGPASEGALLYYRLM